MILALIIATLAYWATHSFPISFLIFIGVLVFR